LISPRYIFTKLEKITRAIFHPDDDPLLSYLHEDGESIEPEFYLPIIPMVLVNGAEGIGTGWSTSVPNYNPRDLIANIYRKLDGEEFEKMHPYFFGFGGTIEANSSNDGGYVVSGKIDRVDDTTLHISELPIKVWTQDYKAFLEKMITGDEKKKVDPEIKDFTENHTDTTVSFTITATKEMIDKFEKEKDGLYGKFKLKTKISTSNMNVFDKHGRIAKFANPEALLDSFYRERLHYYQLRKNHLLGQMRREQRILNNKARFVEEVCAGTLVVSNRKRLELLAELKDRDYELFPKQANNGRKDHESESEEEEDNDTDANSDLAKGYEYLLGMKIWSLTYEKAQQLRRELSEKTKAVEDLEATSPKQLWRNDLKALEGELDDRDQAYADAAEEEIKAQGKNKKHQAKKKKQTRKKVLNNTDDSDDEYLETTKKTTKKPAVKKTVKASTENRVLARSPQITNKAMKKVEIDVNSLDFKSSGSGEDIEMQNDVKTKTTTLQIDSDSEPEESLSLFDRMQRKAGMKNPVSSKPLEAQKRGKKRSSPKASKKDDLDILDDLDSFDTSSYEPASLTPAPKRKKSNNKKVTSKPIQIDSDDDMVDFTKPSKVTKSKKAPIKKQAKAKAIEIESDDESSEGDEDEVIVSNPRSRSTRERKTIKYTVESDEDDGSDDDFDFDD
jgi:DNA topoisomerase-2